MGAQRDVPIPESSLTAALLANLPNLSRHLKGLLQQIPHGRVTTYGDLARALGDAAAARWVGESLVDHAHDEVCNCHRVVRVNGDVGLYVTRSTPEKIALLLKEGIDVENGRVDLARFRFADFRSGAPLVALRELQFRIRDELQIEPLARFPRTVGGVDVSYVSKTEAVAAFVLLDASSRELIWSTTVAAPVTFPYLSGYLSFRELPILLKLFETVHQADRIPDVTLVDGNGILHPRRAGSGTCFGIAAMTPTIGVGKKLLCGSIESDEESSPGVNRIIADSEVLGFAVRATPKSRPFYISPGHCTDMASALSVTRMMLDGKRLPVPIRLADRLSRQEANRRKARSSRICVQ